MSTRLWRLCLAAALAGLAALALAAPALASGTSIFFPTPVSPNGRDIDTLYRWISVPALIIFVGVELALLYVVVRFRRRTPDQVGKQIHGNVPLEIAWFIGPTIIVTLIAYFSFATLVQDFTPEAASNGAQMTIQVKGVQFAWQYTYTDPAYGFTTSKDNRMVVPVDTMIHLEMVSDNVIHSWWVPALTGKTDAVPGYTNNTWIKVDGNALNQGCPGYGYRPGTKDSPLGPLNSAVQGDQDGCIWLGQCAELCGAGHNTMTIEVEAVPMNVFKAWVEEQKNPPSPSPSSTASAARTASPSPSPKPSSSPSP